MTEVRVVTYHPELIERIADLLDSLNYAVDGISEAHHYFDEFSTAQLRELRRILDEHCPEPEDDPEPPAPAPIIEPGWLSLRDAGRYVGGFAGSTVRTWIAEGKLPAKRFGRSIRVRVEDLDAFGDDQRAP